MNTTAIKEEFTTTYKPKLQNFFEPIHPLCQAILDFCKTTIGMVVLGIVVFILVAKAMGGYYHHKYSMRYDSPRDSYYSRGYFPAQHMNPRREIFQETEDYINQQETMMKNRINRMMDTEPTIDEPRGNLQQSRSRVSIINGDNQWYTLTVQDNTIQGTIIGELSEANRQGLQTLNISIDNNKFSVPYTPELLQQLTAILEKKS